MIARRGYPLCGMIQDNHAKTPDFWRGYVIAGVVLGVILVLELIASIWLG